MSDQHRISKGYESHSNHVVNSTVKVALRTRYEPVIGRLVDAAKSLQGVKYRIKYGWLLRISKKSTTFAA